MFSFTSKRILPFLLILFFISGCSQKECGTKHHHYAMGAVLCLPEEWQRVQLSPENDLTSMAFEDGKGGTVILTQYPGKNFREMIRLITEVYHPILEKGHLLFSKHKTVWLTSDKDRTSTITYIVKAKEGRVFIITCSSPSINFVEYKPSFEAIARSFVAY